jgi:hypothetical protein
MATQKDYDTGTAALVVLEQQIIKDKGIPSFVLPSQDQLQQYAAQAAKVVIDAVDAERAAATPVSKEQRQ